MKKIFTFIAAIAMTLTASADQVWDFSVAPTQPVTDIDGTGNIGSNVGTSGVVDYTSPWFQWFNKGGKPDEVEFYIKDGVKLQMTEGLKWGLLDSDKMISWYNATADYGGMYLKMNKEVDCTFPAKKGQVIVFTAASSKNLKTITSMGIDATISIDPWTNYDYKEYSCVVTEDDPYLHFQNNICIQKIVIKDPAPAEYEWDFTVAPTQPVSDIDGTGNIGSNVGTSGVVDYTSPWFQWFNKGGKPDEVEFYIKDGVKLQMTEGLKWGLLDSDKMISWYNATADYGGMYLKMNKEVDCTFPAKTGQYIIFTAASSKNIKTITSMGIDAAISIDQWANYDYKEYYCKVTEDDPYLHFQNNICIQKIKISNTEPTTTGISQAMVARPQIDGAIYNLSGQKVGKDYKGIVIMNGKKMIQK